MTDRALRLVHLAHVEATVKLMLQVAEPSDKIEESSVTRPDTRKKIELGTIATNCFLCLRR
jgi:hypothetical protein